MNIETVMNIIMQLGALGVAVTLVLFALYAWAVREAKKIRFDGMEDQLFNDPDVHIMPVEDE